jgi:hypothetical protein
MESKLNFFFNKQTLGGVIVGACLTLLAVEFFFDIPFSPQIACPTDSIIYKKWYTNYDPSNSYALKVDDAAYISARDAYQNSLPNPMDGAYGGRLDLGFLSSYLCQAKGDGADSIYFYMGQAPNEAAKVYLFSNASTEIGRQVMTFAKVSGCPPNCRDTK